MSVIFVLLVFKQKQLSKVKYKHSLSVCFLA